MKKSPNKNGYININSTLNLRFLFAKTMKMSRLVSFESQDRRLKMNADQKSDAWKEEEKLDGCYMLFRWN